MPETPEQIAALEALLAKTNEARSHLGEDFPVGADWRAVWRDGRAALADAVPALIARIRALEEALEPFAAIPFEQFNDNACRPNDTPLAEWNGVAVTLGDLRRARAALQGGENGE